MTDDGITKRTWCTNSITGFFSGVIDQDEPSPPHPEAYPIPTQTYPRDYFTIPSSKSQDRIVGPGQGPSQHLQAMEDIERLPVVDNIHNNSMQVESSSAHQLVETNIDDEGISGIL